MPGKLWRRFLYEVSSRALLGFLSGFMEQPVKARESLETALKLDPNYTRVFAEGRRLLVKSLNFGGDLRYEI
jgi:hypothetical protein